MGSRAPDIVEALLTVLLRAAPTGVPVWDGPVPPSDTRDALFVGYNPDEGAGGESITSERARINFTGQAYSETVTVPVGAYCRRNGVKLARARVYELLAIAEDAVHASQKLDLPDVQDVQINSSHLFLWPSRGGLEARAVSWVTAQALGGN